VKDLVADENGVTVSPPGFVNFTLGRAFLEQALAGVAADPRAGVPRSAAAETVVIDYSGPNVAKEMHVGHIRSSVIGDALARILGFLGHNVIRQNHVGDWGTPFGMLIEHLEDVGADRAASELSMGSLNEFYQAARQKFDGDSGSSAELFIEEEGASRRLLVVGLGKDSLPADAAEKLGGAAVARLLKSGETHAVIDLGGLGFDADAAAKVALAAELRSWRYDRYHTKLKDKQKPSLKTVTIVEPGWGRSLASPPKSTAEAQGRKRGCRTRTVSASPTSLIVTDLTPRATSNA
jgi:hypothetical protein